MPGNIISINGNDEWYVGDSKMPDLLKFLKKVGKKEIKKRRR